MKKILVSVMLLVCAFAFGAVLTRDNSAKIGDNNAATNKQLEMGSGILRWNGPGGLMEFSNNAGASFTALADFEQSVQPGQVANMSINLSAGTFKVTSADGTAFSGANQGLVTLADDTDAGKIKTSVVTADQSFIDGSGVSEIVGNTFGTTSGVAWAQEVPFYIYAVTNDAQDEIAFMISRDPAATLSPVAAEIGAPDDPVADTENSFFSFENLDETLFDDNPCGAIGTIRMQKDVTDDWTVEVISYRDGISKFHEESWFGMPVGQNGAASTKYFLDNGGTAPAFTNNEYIYRIERSGAIHVAFRFASVSSAGAGSVTTEMALPIADGDYYPTIMKGPAYSDNLAGMASYMVDTGITGAGQEKHYRFRRNDGGVLENDELTLAGHLVSGTFSYLGFRSGN